MKQPWAWVSWLIATVVILSITRNPMYLVIILLTVLVVGLSLRQVNPDISRPFSLWKLIVWIILLAAAFNALTSHYGESVIFTIPGKIPLLSGNVTLEAIIYGLTNGLVLTGMLASFMVLNLALPVRDLISLIPRAFFPLAVVTSIAVTYLPTTMRQFQQIREAQAIRGHQLKSLRDWLPLIMPLLIGGLEHAMQLAEAMTARGFASEPLHDGKGTPVARLGLLVGMVMGVTGWLSISGKAALISWVMIGVGIVLILAGLWWLGHQAPRTNYRTHTWAWQDILTVGGAAAVLGVCFFTLPGINRLALYYEPYPRLSMPVFSPWLGIALLGLLLPGFFVLAQDQNTTHHQGTEQFES